MPIRASILTGLIVSTLLCAQLDAAEPPVNFARDIKPILAGKCFACHGPDEAQRKGELRLDTRDGALASKAFTPGEAAKSELLARVTSTDPDTQMPPADSKKPGLTPTELALVTRWIDAGGKYDAHWAYVSPARTTAPETAPNQTWPQNTIDRFILPAQTQQGLQPSPAADKQTLIRRLSLDLTGLPPSPKEVEAFVADPSPQAYEKLVDRLLDSPHYGERMAMFWLDLVRYADTGGYHSDNHRDVSPYRDWVIAAFNQNLPFDRFTIDQLAGDLLPAATSDQKIASGYNRLLMTTEEGGAQAKEYIAKYQADRVRNVSNVWLGATLGCAECHNHKFDPYTAKDFYRFAAFFADIQEKAVGRQDQVKVPTSEQQKQIQAIDQRLVELRKQLEVDSPELAAGQAKWEVQVRDDVAAKRSVWNSAKPEQLASSGKQTLTIQDDLSVLASGENPAKDTYAVTLPVALDRVTALRLETLTHDSLANKGLSRANGNFVLTGLEVERVNADGTTAPLKIAAAQADFSQNGHPITNVLDKQNKTGWAVGGHEKPANHVAVFTLAEPLTGAAGQKLVVRMKHESQYAQHNIGRFRWSLTSVDKPGLEDQGGVPPNIAALVILDAAKRTPDQLKQLSQHYRTLAPELETVRQQIVQAETDRKNLDAAAPQTLISQTGAPRMVRILPRGNWLDDNGEVVEPGVPAFLPQLTVQDRRATRLDLAQWLVSPDNPLVARVFVNRLWKLMYGHGLARNLDDYGTQGTYPSHPELLDYLALEFRESDWNVRHLLKLMAMSSTYQQSSAASAEQRSKDPGNQFFARQDRYRIDAEFVRDNALAASGLLVRQIGGPSVKPYQPEGYWQFLNFPARTYQNDHGEGLYRRGMYTYWQRSFLNPSLLAFDAPSREECTAERPRSNTPVQALALLNDPTYVEAARALANRVIVEGGTAAAQRIDYAFVCTVSRPATAQEQQLLGALYQKHLQQYQADPAQATQALANGESKPPAGVDATELAAWTSVMRVILNLHETVTRN